MKPTTYRLIGKLAVPATPLLQRMEEAAAKVRDGSISIDQLPTEDELRAGGGIPYPIFQDVIGGVLVSTIFLGTDHNWARLLIPDAPAILFETMVVGGELNGVGGRYSTWEDAEEGHAATVARVRARVDDA